MTITYRGITEENRFRGADIWYNDESEKECKMIETVVCYLEKVCGYEVDTGVSGWCGIALDEPSEYRDLVAEYKKAKRIAANSWKFGFYK